MQQYTTDRERVAVLIDSYREEIGGKNSGNVKAIQDYVDAEEKKIQESFAKREENGEDVYSFITDIQIPIELENKTKANEQLLGHFYSKVAGNEADKNVLLQLLGDYYDETFFSSEEESFLLAHFTELTNYIINTSFIAFQEYSDLKDAHLIPSEVLEFIVRQVEIPQEAVIYNPFSGFCQFTTVFNSNHFICEESYTAGIKHDNSNYQNWLWAWMKVALYANNANVEIINGEFPSSYDVVLSYIPFLSIDFFKRPNDSTLRPIRDYMCDPKIVNKLWKTYKHLNKGGKMILLLPDFLFRNNRGYYPLNKLWKQIWNDNSLTKIIQFPSTCNNLNYCFCLVVIEKENSSSYVTMLDTIFAAKKNDDSKIIEHDELIDAFVKASTSNTPTFFRSVYIEGEKKVAVEFNSPFFQTIDLQRIYDTIYNNGIDSNTGARKKIAIPKRELNFDILLPQFYTIEKPICTGKTIPLSELCTYVSNSVRDIDKIIPIDTKWVKDNNLDYIFEGPLNISELEKANCPNIPPHTSDFTFTENGDFYEEYPWSQRTPIGKRVLEYRNSTFLDISRGAVLLKEDSKGIRFAVVPMDNNSIAVHKGIKVFCPNDGVQVYTLAAILKMPIVYRQIQVYEKFGLSNYLDTIIVPYDKWLIDNEVSRLLNEEKTYNRYKEDYESIKRSVRMRKHALTQSLSSIEAMFYALNAYRNRNGGNIVDGGIISRIKGTTVSDAFEFLGKSINDMRPALEHIAEVEYTFADPDWIDPEVFIESYISKNEKGWINFKPSVTWDKGNNLAKNDLREPLTGNIIIRKGEAHKLFSFPKDALEKVFDNIISNAQSHGFKNNPRKDLEIKFSWHTDGTSIIVEVENNGLPISANCDTASLLEYGVSTMLHQDGHNGIGCNEIDNIMRRYDSKVKIVSNPKHEFTVKYILTFNRSNFA